MYIPVFEIKDSYIVKHKLQYDTSINNELPYKMVFIDYDLARKSQTTNAENFTSIEINDDLSMVDNINISYFDDLYNIKIDDELSDEIEFNNSTVINNDNYHQYNVENSELYDVDELVDVIIYQKNTITGTTSWEHTSYITDDIWFVSGETDNGTQWVVTGTTTEIGYNSGVTNWSVDEITTLLSYNTKIISNNTSYIKVSKNYEDYLYNDFLSQYDNLFYKIKSKNNCLSNYNSLYNILLMCPWIENFDMKLTSNNSIILTPIYNSDDIYFNYDALNINVNVNNILVEYKFTTNNLYNKYNLMDMFSQFGYDLNDKLFGDNLTQNVTEQIISNDTSNGYYLDLIVSNTNNLYVNTVINIVTDKSNNYNVLITNIIDDIIRIIKPLNFIEKNVELGITRENIVSLSNLNKMGDISDFLQTIYENYEHDEYRKYSNKVQKLVYNAYGELISNLDYNQELRQNITGLIYENSNNIMVLKVFSPADYIDDRLLYEPIEIVRIGKNRKTSIPYTIKTFKKGFNC